MNIAKIFLLLSTLNGGLAVCLGAFGSHGLKSRLPENLLQAWTTRGSSIFITGWLCLVIGLFQHRNV